MTVTEATRSGTNPWSVTGVASALTSGANTIPASALSVSGHYFRIAKFMHLLRAQADVKDGKVHASGRLYAVDNLRTPVLLVLGHDKCGAVAAAASGEAMPSLGLDVLVRKIEPAVARVRGQASGDALVDLAVDANVQQSARDLLESSAILRRHADAGRLTVIKARYRLASGEVVRLA